jgi:hypothetical protein
MDIKSSLNHRRLFIFVLTIMFLVAGVSGCDQASTDIHTGTPVKVLVVFNEMTKQPNCPTLEACAPSFDQKVIDIVQPPRHYASEYLALLDEEVNT